MAEEKNKQNEEQLRDEQLNDVTGGMGPTTSGGLQDYQRETPTDW